MCLGVVLKEDIPIIFDTFLIIGMDELYEKENFIDLPIILYFKQWFAAILVPKCLIKNGVLKLIFLFQVPNWNGQ